MHMHFPYTHTREHTAKTGESVRTRERVHAFDEELSRAVQQQHTKNAINNATERMTQIDHRTAHATLTHTHTIYAERRFFVAAGYVNENIRTNICQRV